MPEPKKNSYNYNKNLIILHCKENIKCYEIVDVKMATLQQEIDYARALTHVGAMLSNYRVVAHRCTQLAYFWQI